ncbi:MAG: thioredoxin domain-containing protein [Candidatus Binataceae bacterium]
MALNSRIWRRTLTVVGAAIICAMAMAAASAAADSGAGKVDPNKVVATVGKHKITEREVDKQLKPQLDEMRAKLEAKVDQIVASQTFDLRRRTAEAMVNDYLIEHAAKKAGLSVPEFEKKEAAGKSGVTEAAAKEFYNKNKSGAPVTFEQVKPRLLDAMNEQALLERLRKQTPVHILLEPKRIAVDTAGHFSRGPQDAPVTLVEFSDFQCPFCGRAEPTVDALMKKYGDKLRLVYMDYPLPFHSHSMLASTAARCAGAQGKFWQFHDLLFKDQPKFARDDPKAFSAKMKSSAETMGLNIAKFDSCFDGGKYDAVVKKDIAYGDRLHVSGTPSFFIDGRFINGAQQIQTFEGIIDDELANGAGGQKQASAR